MNKIEQLHLEAIDTNMWVEGGEYEYAEKAASKSAEITEDIAIEFAEWILESDHIIWSTSKKELFQEFLKTKK